MLVGSGYECAMSPLLVYSRIRSVTRTVLVSQVAAASRMFTPRKKTRAAQGSGGRGRMQSEEPRPRVCRRLFAEEEDADDTEVEAEAGARDNLLNQISEHINRDLDDACKKYNFDFRSEQPLEGDWVWERLQSHPSERRARSPPPPPTKEAPPPGKENPGPQDKPAPPPLRL